MHVAVRRPENLYRSAQHVLSALVVLLLIETIFDHHAAILVSSGFAAFAWGLEITRRRWPSWNRVLMRTMGLVAHEHEAHAVNSATWMSTGLAIIAPFFSLPTCALALVTLGFGDPAAGFIGRRYGRHKLVNNRSAEGTVAYALVAFLAGLAVLTIWHPQLGVRGVLAAALAAVVGALTELFCRTVDDNFAVPVLTAAAVGLVLQGSVGW
jgi:dolichol kinase